MGVETTLYGGPLSQLRAMVGEVEALISGMHAELASARAESEVLRGGKLSAEERLLALEGHCIRHRQELERQCEQLKADIAQVTSHLAAAEQERDRASKKATELEGIVNRLLLTLEKQS